MRFAGCHGDSAGGLLRADAEGSLRGDVLFYCDMSKGGFADIPEIVRTGRPGHSVTLGPEGFDLLGEDPGRLDVGFVPGSFFGGPPPPADCYLLKYIIHD